MITYCYTFIHSNDVLCYSPYLSFMVQVDSRIGQLHVSYQLLEVNMENNGKNNLEKVRGHLIFPFFAISLLALGLKMKSWICKLCNQRPNFPDTCIIPFCAICFSHVLVFLWTCSFYITFHAMYNPIYC